MNREIVCLSDLYKRVNSQIYGLYECYCGKIFSSIKYDVKRGHTKSCGCLSIQKNTLRLTTHGKKFSPEYNSWINMRQRCLNKNVPGYKDYGGRGITICQEWLDSFESFYIDMGPKPGKGYSIERVDNSKGYYKDNCIWATRKIQNNNQRSNRIITFNGKTQNLTAWAKETGFAFDTLRARLDNYGWSVEKAFTTPLKVQRGKNRS